MGFPDNIAPATVAGHLQLLYPMLRAGQAEYGVWASGHMLPTAPTMKSEVENGLFSLATTYFPHRYRLIAMLSTSVPLIQAPVLEGDESGG